MSKVLDLRWGAGRMMFGPSGPAVITVIGANVADRSPELWVQPYEFADAISAEKLVAFTPTVVDANTVAMACGDISPINRVNARWVLSLDGNPVAGGFCTGSIEGSDDRTDTIVINEGQGTIEFGGTDDPDDLITVMIPARAGKVLVVAGLILTGSRPVTAFAATADVVSLFGYVNRIA